MQTKELLMQKKYQSEKLSLLQKIVLQLKTF